MPDIDPSRQLLHAIRAGELVLHYQPKLNLPTNRIVEVEALLRWDHPDRGLLLPPAFLDVPLSREVARELGGWVARTALEQIVLWSAGGIGLGVCINFSPRQLIDPELLTTLDAATAETGVNPVLVNVEITEIAALADLDATIERVLEIRRRGMDVSLDDFGTGYSSLTWLQLLPVTMLKLDRSFIVRLGEHTQTNAIVDAVIRLAHALGLVTIAEGVETSDQLAHLRALDCDQVQGFYVSPPVPAEQIPALL